MKGHEPLIDMRRTGSVPASVWFAFEGEAWRLWPQSLGVQWKRFPGAMGSAEVLIEPGDSIARLDLRFAVGLRCWVQGDDEARVKQLHQALADAGAERVLLTVMKANEQGVLKTAEMLDTAGQFVGAW